MNKKRKSILEISFCLVVLIGAVTGYFVYQNFNSKEDISAYYKYDDMANILTFSVQEGNKQISYFLGEEQKPTKYDLKGNINDESIQVANDGTVAYLSDKQLYVEKNGKKRNLEKQDYFILSASGTKLVYGDDSPAVICQV